ncbi:MAG: hypothetical protein HPY66_1612 [Firmicutes bacterium]|nr:hypothetical protein [Bacillota bacterium]
MYFTVFVKGIIIGLSVAAPVGPIGILCIRRTLAHGRIAGLMSGLGAASADVIYGIIAGFGMTVITNILVGHKQWISLVGGILLCCLGARMLAAKPAEEQAAAKGKGLIGSYLSTLLLTLTNPMTIIFFMAVFASLGAAAVQDAATPWVLVSGVFTGSAAWWFALSFGVSVFRSRLNPGHLRLINVISGSIVIFFGIGAITGLV